MAKDTVKVKGLTGGEDENFPDFIFAHDLLGEEGEQEEMEEEITELVDVMEEDTIPESVKEDTEHFEELVLDKEDAEESFGARTEPFLALEEDLNLDEEPDESSSDGDIDEEKEQQVEEPGQEETQDKEQAVEDGLTGMPPTEEIVKEEEAAPSISEEQIEALLTKVVTDVLRTTTREILFEVAEKVIKEELDALKRSITALD